MLGLGFDANGIVVNDTVDVGVDADDGLPVLFPLFVFAVFVVALPPLLELFTIALVELGSLLAVPFR